MILIFFLFESFVLQLERDQSYWFLFMGNEVVISWKYYELASGVSSGESENLIWTTWKITSAMPEKKFYEFD